MNLVSQTDVVLNLLKLLGKLFLIDHVLARGGCSDFGSVVGTSIGFGNGELFFEALADLRHSFLDVDRLLLESLGHVLANWLVNDLLAVDAVGLLIGDGRGHGCSTGCVLYQSPSG